MLHPLAFAAVSLLAQGTQSQPALPDRSPELAPSPYDFSAATALLESELPNLRQRVAVIVRQGGREIFRFQHGSIDFDTRTRMASVSKSISAGVMLSAIEDDLLSLDDPIGDSFPLLFQQPGIGDPTVLDCWSMRHGIDARFGYEHMALFTHWQSVVQIGRKGFELFPSGERLGYSGIGMQVSGYIAVERSGLAWEDLAEQRILGPLGMDTTDYLQFAPNPSVPGGMRSTALDAMNFAQMILDEGEFNGQAVLQPASIERFFTNHTRGLPVEESPFPSMHPDYPYGVRPDYGFGGWVLAEDPATQHVEEIIGAGAWGSYLWMDRRRDLTAVLVTDVPVGSQSSSAAALGLFTIARAAVEGRQVRDLTATASGAGVTLHWTPPTGSGAVRVVGSPTPILDVFDLRKAVHLGTSSTGQLSVPSHQYYAATATVERLHNSALIPGVNSIEN